MTAPHPAKDHLLELLADRALFGLSLEEQRELSGLLAAMPDVDAEELERLAAAVQLMAVSEQAEMPQRLKSRIATDGRAMVARYGKATTAKTVQNISRRELVAWLAAAASVLVALFWANRSDQQQISVLTPVQLKTELLGSGESLTKVAWASGPDDAGKVAQGEVIWNNKRQQGVMSFRGLPANDPSKQQYQLWIFDTAQDEKYPIDGGVFDMPAGVEEALIPIDAKLPVVEPTLFAITIEKPGGVVVSSRERLPLLAQVTK